MNNDQQDPEGQQIPILRFPVAVVTECRPSTSPWADTCWEVLGISAGSGSDAAASGSLNRVFQQDGVERYLQAGFNLELHPDECESYYFNLLSEQPRCFVVADMADDGVPAPVLVSLSFDEAHAYLEGERSVYAVNLPPEIYRWVEGYVLANYVPERKLKRKRDNWKAPGEEGRRR